MRQNLLYMWTPSLLSVLRIVTGFLFMLHGTQKLFGMPVSSPGGPADVVSLMGVAGVLEFGGGMLILLGLLTRPIAFLLSGEMAAAYFMAHLPQNFWPIVNGGELAALYSFLFLYFVAAGPGPLSVDAFIANRRAHHQRPFYPAHAGTRSL